MVANYYDIYYDGTSTYVDSNYTSTGTFYSAKHSYQVIYWDTPSTVLTKEKLKYLKSKENHDHDVSIKIEWIVDHEKQKSYKKETESFKRERSPPYHIQIANHYFSMDKTD